GWKRCSPRLTVRAIGEFVPRDPLLLVSKTFPTSMRIALGIFLVLGVSSLRAADWPGVKYSEVRAYYYNAASAHDCRILDAKGRLDESVVDKKGVVLSPAQVVRLLAAINGHQRVHPITACYVPHHAFIFYNSFGRRVAVFEFCFECLKASPD